MLDWLKSWIKNDMQIVLRAKLAFFTTLILAFGLAYWAASWRYSGIVDNLKALQQAQEERHKTDLKLLKTEPSSFTTVTKPKIVTISSNEIALSGPGLYLVDTENMSMEDDLSRIIGLSKGEKVTLRAASNDRTIAVRASRYLKMAHIVFFLNNKNDKIEFTCGKNGVCVEDSRVSIGD